MKIESTSAPPRHVSLALTNEVVLFHEIKLISGTKLAKLCPSLQTHSRYNIGTDVIVPPMSTNVPPHRLV